jgi:hypothetical protein
MLPRRMEALHQIFLFDVMSFLLQKYHDLHSAIDLSICQSSNFSGQGMNKASILLEENDGHQFAFRAI